MSRPWIALLLVLLLGLTTCGTAGFTEPGSPLPVQPSPMSATAPGATWSVQGNSYYVDPAGDDGDDGSSAHPWRTIQHAVDSVTPGDTILVRGGTYAGARIERSGTAEAWITLKAALGAIVLINAPGPDNRHDSNVEFETWEGDGTVAYWVIEGLDVANAPNWGIDIRGNEENHSHHITVRGNAVHDNGLSSGVTGIFTAFSDYILVENNESYGNGEHGVYLSNSGDHSVVRGNRLHHNVNCGLHMNGDASMGGDGVISDVLVEKNVIYENGAGGGSAINMDGVTDSLVRNNLLYRNHAGGLAVFQSDGAVCSQNNRFLNNTIVMAVDGRWAVNISQSDCLDNKLFNNIIYSDHSWRGSIFIASADLAGFESDYNVVLDRFSVEDDGVVISLSEWQALGYDAHSLIATPAALFLDATGDNYHLPAGSPAVDQGTTLADVSDDLDGRPRPAGAGFDIGAYEYVDLAYDLYLPVVVTPWTSRSAIDPLLSCGRTGWLLAEERARP